MVINGVVVPVLRVHANNLPSLPINMQSVNMHDPSSGMYYNLMERHWIKMQKEFAKIFIIIIEKPRLHID